MTDNSPNEKYIQAKTILKRWHRGCILWSALLSCSLMFIGHQLLFIGNIDDVDSVERFYEFVILLPVLVGLIYAIVYQVSLRFSLQRLSQTDVHLLEQAESLWRVDEQKEVEVLLKAYKNKQRKLNPQKEYLRPSQQTQDETLLRATASTDNALQEQLLRPSQTEERQ